MASVFANGVASKACVRPRFELKSRSEAGNCQIEIENGLRDQRKQEPPSWKEDFRQRNEEKDTNHKSKRSE
ncbi:hypothetical protein NDU88_010235 [Pleurodeles waltl]|uniref:Uncharacterized protein n=1 Tax=Pleurodeles waltl TaxID=8319 RepID=A0AAV7QV45_PLEWA|nr:hypothetical protein NDU88_010235 [Pleurodeles waltl]